MTIKILNFLQKLLLLLSFILIFSCQPNKKIDFNSRDAFFKSLDKVEFKKNEKTIIKNDFKKINKKKLKKLKPPIKTKKIQTNSKKIDPKKKHIFDLKKYINKKEQDLIKVFGTPNMLIKHGIISNYQYHLKNCFVDLFFINKNRKIILNHFEFRSSKTNSKLNKKLCIKDILSLKNNNNTID